MLINPVKITKNHTILLMQDCYIDALAVLQLYIAGWVVGCFMHPSYV